MFKNALISVSDKTGLIEFLKPYVEHGLRVVSTGGTLKHLRENGIAAIEVSEQTGFPEVMDGRVKTLHPRVHMALLARSGNSADDALLKKEALDAFDLVIVNLYPFADALKKNLPDHDMIEFIDIGGPSLLRAAAKNHDRLTVVCEPEDYVWIGGKKELTLADRRRLAARVFRHTSRYDDLIGKYLATADERPETLVGSLVDKLRYGENPQQSAFWYRRLDAKTGLHDAEILHGKPLSFNNLLDLEAAVATVREFELPAAVAVKHTNPCGVATGPDLATAVSRAVKADPVSVFGGIIAVNEKLTLSAAEELSKIFLECIIAPDFAPDALEKLKKKKDLRLLVWPHLMKPAEGSLFRSIDGGYLVQTVDRPLTVNQTGKVWPASSTDSSTASPPQSWPQEWQLVGQPPEGQVRTDLLFAWRLVKHLKSNAIAIAGNGCSLGLGMGQVNRVDAVEQAIARMKKHHPDFGSPELASSKKAVLASDAFFPFPDSVELAAQAGLLWVIQPGGSIRDGDVIARARELGVNMVLTGTRHFLH